MQSCVHLSGKNPDFWTRSVRSGCECQSRRQNENTPLSLRWPSFDLSPDLWVPRLGLKAVGATLARPRTDLLFTADSRLVTTDILMRTAHTDVRFVAYDVCACKFLSSCLITPPDYLIFNFPAISGVTRRPRHYRLVWISKADMQLNHSTQLPQKNWW